MSGAFHLPTTGDPISMFYVSAPSMYPADTPFFIRHGNVCATNVVGGGTALDCLSPKTRLEVIVDGVRAHTAVDLHVDNDTGIYTKTHLANFRFGVPAGSHTFVANWYDETGTTHFTTTITILFT